MKVFALFTLLMVASCQASFFDGISTFLNNLFTDFGHKALDTIAETGAKILQNATATTANLLAETGQLALFELGNQLGSSGSTGTGKRNAEQVVSQLMQLQHAVDGELGAALAKTYQEVQQLVDTAKTIVNRLLQGHVDPLAVLEFIPQFQTAIQQIKSDLNNGLFTKVLALLDPHRSKRQLNFLSHLATELQTLLQPLNTLLEQELGQVVNVMQVLAHELHTNQNPVQVATNLLQLVHL